MSETERVQTHMAICKELNDTYARKNADYGDSFHKQYMEYGPVAACIRLEDKLLRLKTLTKQGYTPRVSESMEDTIKDMANYAIMLAMEFERETEDERIAD